MRTIDMKILLGYFCSSFEWSSRDFTLQVRRWEFFCGKRFEIYELSSDRQRKIGASEPADVDGCSFLSSWKNAVAKLFPMRSGTSKCIHGSERPLIWRGCERSGRWEGVETPVRRLGRIPPCPRKFAYTYLRTLARSLFPILLKAVFLWEIKVGLQRAEQRLQRFSQSFPSSFNYCLCFVLSSVVQ